MKAVGACVAFGGIRYKGRAKEVGLLYCCLNSRAFWGLMGSLNMGVSDQELSSSWASSVSTHVLWKCLYASTFKFNQANAPLQRCGHLQNAEPPVAKMLVTGENELLYSILAGLVRCDPTEFWCVCVSVIAAIALEHSLNFISLKIQILSSQALIQP